MDNAKKMKTKNQPDPQQQSLSSAASSRNSSVNSRQSNNSSSSSAYSSRSIPLMPEPISEASEQLFVDHALVETMEKSTQETLLKTFEYFYDQESDTVITALSESRGMIQGSMLGLVEEQVTLKDKLCEASDGKYDNRRKIENSIPLAEYLRKKRGLPSLVVTTVVEPSTKQRQLAEKEAVDKYLRKRERQRVSESNRLNRELTEQSIEVETQKILNKLKNVDQTKEKERERQLERIQQKLKGKPEQKNDQQKATQIIEDYQESQMAYERDKRLQQEKFKARLSAARDRRALTPTGRDLDSDQNSFINHTNQNKLAPPVKNVPSIDI